MIHFVFDWISSSSPWIEKMNQWYRNQKQLSFNENVEYIKRFDKKNLDYQALVLYYSPQFRYYLQSQGIPMTKYWSAFDWVQGIDISEVNLIDYRQLPWPSEAEFLYNPFSILVLVHEKLFAKIEFGNEGQLIWIDYYKNEFGIERHYWDDRGFISSIATMSLNKTMESLEYLDLSGEWVLREDFSEDKGKIEINSKYKSKFKLLSYSSMEEIITEIIMRHNYIIDKNTRFILPYKPQVLKVFDQIKDDNKIMLVNYSTELGDSSPIIETGIKQVVVGNYGHKAILEEAYPNSQIHFMPPVDSRVKLGQSNRVKQEILLVILDTVALLQFGQIAEQLSEIIKYHQDIEIRFAMVNALEENRLNLIKHIKNSSLAEYYEINKQPGSLLSNISYDETLIEDEIIAEPQVLNLEAYLIELLQNARLTIDLSSKPNDYVKLSCLSAGIPMILSQDSIYVQHLENGWILKSLKQLSHAVSYYFRSLNNWNLASIAAAKKSESLLEQFDIEKLLLGN